MFELFDQGSTVKMQVTTFAPTTVLVVKGLDYGRCDARTPEEFKSSSDPLW